MKIKSIQIIPETERMKLSFVALGEDGNAYFLCPNSEQKDWTILPTLPESPK